MSRIRLLKSVKKFADFLFPDNYTCIGCDEELFIPNDRYALCSDCQKEIVFIKSYCLRCGRPTKYGEYCHICKKGNIYFDKCYSCFSYEGLIKRILRRYKFENYRFYYKYLAAFCLDKIALSNISADVICCAPMLRKDKDERGYNQSELIAKHIAKTLNIPYIQQVAKKKGRGKQVGKSWKDRILNAKNAYYVIGDAYKGKTVLVFDDVITTGSTMNNIAKAILKSGATSVIGLTLCATPFKNENGEMIDITANNLHNFNNLDDLNIDE